MADVTAKLAEALELIAATDPIEAALDPQRAIRVAREALRLYDEAKAQPVQDLPTYSELVVALRNANGRLRLAIEQERYKMLDVIYEREANALLARIPDRKD